MPMLGLDYAGGVPSGAAIRKAGYVFVARYLTSGGTSLPGKLLTAAEYADLMAHGVAVVVNFETTADRMLSGHSAGVADAEEAHATAIALGIASDRPIVFSADWDATPEQQTVIDAYLTGVASVIGASRVGIYGSYYVIGRCLDNGTARWAWQSAAWSGGLTDPRAHIYQRVGFARVGGVECDVNEALQIDFGQHPYSVPSGDLDMPAGVIPAGPQVTKLVMPIGPSVSRLVSEGWLSLACSEDAPDGHAWIQGPRGGIADYRVPFLKDKRWWIPLPDGTDQMTVHTDAPPGSTIGWCLELRPL